MRMKTDVKYTFRDKDILINNIQSVIDYYDKKEYENEETWGPFPVIIEMLLQVDYERKYSKNRECECLSHLGYNPRLFLMR